MRNVSPACLRYRATVVRWKVKRVVICIVVYGEEQGHTALLSAPPSTNHPCAVARCFLTVSRPKPSSRPMSM